MPTYQYACKQCGHQFDAIQSFSDASLTACPECSGTLRKLFGSVGVVFKGSGFYRNDSRSASSTAATGASSTSSTTTSTSESSSTSSSDKSSSGSSTSTSSNSSGSSAPAAKAS